MTATLSRILPHPLYDLLCRGYRRWKYPYLVTVSDFTTPACTFEVTNPVEATRVQQLGQEAAFIQMILDELVPGDIFFDVGSCVGLVAVTGALQGATVYAFEPDPGFQKRLERNIALNQLQDRINIVPWAVSDRSGYMPLFSDGVEGNSPSFVNDGLRAAAQVETRSLDDAIDAEELPSPDVIKFDIEGAEGLALAGSTHLLSGKNAPRTIFIEFHLEWMGRLGSSMEACMSLVGENGYRQHYASERSDQIHYIFKR